MSEVFRPRKWYWDAYEKSLLGFASELQEDFRAVPSINKSQAVWQMFLYIFDASLVPLGESFFETVAESLCGDAHQRIQARKTALTSIVEFLPEAHEVWEYQMKQLALHYSEWLVDLING
ncbi:MAG: hypothetical protein ACXADS_15560 [Candidatus Thorarchaeota archaeon]|jgi:hypothetical protein